MTAENVTRTLREIHERLTEDQREMPTAQGVVDGFHKAGLLDDETARLWKLALHACPGHQACQVWCAYCGDIPAESEEVR